MVQWWRGGLAALGVFALFWVFSAWQWQTQAVDVQARDLWLQLLLAPVLVCLAGCVAWLLLRRMRSGGASSVPASLGAASGPLAASASPHGPATPASPSLPPLALCGHALTLPGDLAHHDAHEVAQALLAGQCRPTLDPALTDLDGMPVFTARASTLGCEPVADEDCASEHAPEHAPWPPEGRVARTQALLADLSSPIWSQVEDALPSWSWASAQPPQLDGQGAASGAPSPTWLAGVARPSAVPQGPRGRLFVRVLVPQAWPQAWQQAAVDAVVSQAPEWLRSPGVHARMVLDAAPWPVPDAEGLWGHVADWRAVQARRPSPESLWVVGADSLIDADHIDQLQALGELFTPHHQLGRIPGEGAAAVWLCTPEWLQMLAESATVADPESPMAPPAAPEHAEAGVHLTAVGQARRERSADLHGRVHTGTLRALLAEVPVMPEVLVTDADHRASRTAELFEALTEWAPAIDPMQQVLRLGDACGDLGLVRGLACLALAAGLTGPTTVALVHDPLRRTVLHLRSPSEPEVVK